MTLPFLLDCNVGRILRVCRTHIMPPLRASLSPGSTFTSQPISNGSLSMSQGIVVFHLVIANVFRFLLSIRFHAICSFSFSLPWISFFYILTPDIMQHLHMMLFGVGSSRYHFYYMFNTLIVFYLHYHILSLFNLNIFRT